MKNFTLATLLIIATIVSSCSSKDEYNARYISSSSKRGNPYDYDAGAPKNSKWVDLFAETPNYRSFGSKVISAQRGEKFRWKFGPMWYRGRLQPSQVKVFIIGQEGAQDENLSNRAFTGSTGTRMQKFLNYIGINNSYLFMNTFVYTITGQYSLFGEDKENPAKVKAQQQMLWLAQNSDSIVVEHRHKLFDYMLSTNKNTLNLVIGVGTAGKDSAATWARHHGANCSASKLSRSYCDGVGKLAGVKIIGVRHPGAASARNGGEGAVSGLVQDFRNKASFVAKFIKEKRSFLPEDNGISRNLNKDFRYGYAAIPHKDFPFGTNWKMGKRGTTSNRRKSDTIQVFSDRGCYNNTQRINGRCDAKKVHRISYTRPKDQLTTKPVEMKAGDVPYESPKSSTGRREYDEGPGVYAKAMIEYYDQNYWNMGITAHQSFGPMGIYRGRFNKAKVLVLADQFSHDDMFSGRALSGEGGQKLQTFLKAMGATSSYAIIRSLPVDSLDLSIEKRTEIALDKSVSDARLELINAAIANGDSQIVLAVGQISQAIANTLNFDVPVFNLNAPTSISHVSQWNSVLKKIKTKKIKFDRRGKSSYSGKVSIIPRADLPAYTRWWMGTSGSRAARAFEKINGKNVYNGNYYKSHAPRWATRWKSSVSPLTTAEKASIRKFDKTGL